MVLTSLPPRSALVCLPASATLSCSVLGPQVSIGSPEKMEPITKVSHIPSSRWALVCSLCNEKCGASIQVQPGPRASSPFLCRREQSGGSGNSGNSGDLEMGLESRKEDEGLTFFGGG